MTESTDQMALAQQLAVWVSGLDGELHFWDQWLATQGLQWPDDFQSRLDPHREIEPWLLCEVDNGPVRVLDVGSGPLTCLGFYHRGRRVELTACDPLAPFYAELIAKHGVSCPVPTQLGFAEDLSAFFSLDEFDVVHCRNALDHSFEPVRGIEEMLLVLKPGGQIVLSHVINEAEHGQYVGLHQWNFDSSDGDFIIWNKSHTINANKHFAQYADIVVDNSRPSWINVTFRKTASPPVAIERYRVRVGELLTAMLRALGASSLTSKKILV